MKKMAEMQMSVVVDPRSKHAIDKQICQWDENLEKLYIEQYRLRCYTCSLQGTELPNPKVLGLVVSSMVFLSKWKALSNHKYIGLLVPACSL